MVNDFKTTLGASGRTLAYGRADHTLRALYRVRFRQRDLWPDYAGPAADTVEIELYDHWLEDAR